MRFCVAVVVGWLEWGLLVRIGLGVGGKVNRRGSIASMTRSARIGEGGRINFHFHTSRWGLVETRVWAREYRRVLNDGVVSATLGMEREALTCGGEGEKRKERRRNAESNDETDRRETSCLIFLIFNLL